MQAVSAPAIGAPRHNATRGILLVLLAWLLLACMDAGSKLLAQDYAVVQILWLRFVGLVVVSFWLARRYGASFATRHLGLQALRSIVLVVEIGLFIWAITVLPLASAHAVLALTPLIVTALSVPLLGERIGVRRASAIAVAFAGVLIILRPGLAVIQPMALVALLCAFMFALYQVLTRIVGRDDPPLVTLFYTALIGAIGLTVIGPFFWTWPTLEGWLLFLLVAVLGGTGHFLLIRALQLAPAATIQPFGYTILVWATLIGFLVFGNLPDLWTMAGAAVIVASGLYTFAREHRVAAGG